MDKIIQELGASGLSDFIDLLDRVPGEKLLVLDPALSRTLRCLLHVDGMVSWAPLKKVGVAKRRFLSQTPIPVSDLTLKKGSLVQSIIFVCRSRLANAQLVSSQVQHLATATNLKLRLETIFVPRVHPAITGILMREKVYNMMVVREAELNVVPVEADVFSIEQNGSFKDMFVDLDTSPVMDCACALNRLQSLCGRIPLLRGKGRFAEMIGKAISDPHEAEDDFTEGTRITLPPTPEIQMGILIDRDVDLVTPMLTQLTYQGLIDEVFGISHNSVTFEHWDPTEPEGGAVSKPLVPPTVEKATGSDGQTTVCVALTERDSVFQELRDYTWRDMGVKLKSKVAQLQSAIADERKDTSRDIARLRAYRQKADLLAETKALATMHIAIATKLQGTYHDAEFTRRVTYEHGLVADSDEKPSIDYIRELLYSGAPLTSVLRFACLVSHALPSGIKGKYSFELFCKEVTLCHGVDGLAALMRCEASGMLRRPEGMIAAPLVALRLPVGSGFTALRNKLRLWSNKVSGPNDLSYIYSGYAPIIPRIIEKMLRDGWKAAVDVLPQPFSFEMPEQSHATHSALSMPFTPVPSQSGPSDQDLRRERTILVFFVGGVTHAEVSALRLLSSIINERRELPRSVVCMLLSFIGSLPSLSPSCLWSVFGARPCIVPHLPLRLLHTSRIRFLIGTTHFMNGTTLVESVIQSDDRS